MNPSSDSIPCSSLPESLKLRFFIYTAGTDYYLGPRHCDWQPPVAGLTRADVDTADFFLLPEDLRRLQIDLGIDAVRLFAEALPYYQKYPERHIFWSSHDDPRSPLPEAIFCKASVSSNEPGKYIAVPYRVDDLEQLCHFDPARIKWQTSFVGYPGSSPLREQLLLAVAASKFLSSHLDIAPKFHWHLNQADQRDRRERYLNRLADSLTVLCPRGDGMNSIRFFEALSAGKIPVLLADNCLLPFEKLIRYDRFVIRIPEQDADNTDKHILSWIGGKDSDELMQRCWEARQAWQQLLEPEGMMKGLQQMLRIEHISVNTRSAITQSYLQQGLNAYLTGELRAAETLFRKALDTTSDNLEAVRCLALLLNETGRPEDCIALLTTTQTQAHVQQLSQLLGEAYQQTAQWEEAYQQFYTALAEEPHNTQLLMNMGLVCNRLGRLDDAVLLLCRAAELEPASARIQMNLGCLLQSHNRIEEATAALRQAVQLEPEYATARWNLAQLLLLKGDFEEGLELFESRFSKRDPVIQLKVAAPLWQGEPLSGRSIVITTEQAFGDAIQFVRYLPLLSQLGARVILYNHLKPLHRLLLSIPGVSAVLSDKRELPAADYHLPMLSLPRLLGTRLETIPGRMIPYLAPSAEKVNQWTQKLKPTPGIKIGLCWAGRQEPDPLRSATLVDFAPLAALPEAVFYSLQLGEGSEQATVPPAGMGLVDLTGAIKDFEDTAALILQLDLIITIDTSVAHLAGALGKPVYTLLPFAPDWRWLLERDDSPWYPTMRLFRQDRAGSWSEPISCILSHYRHYFHR